MVMGCLSVVPGRYNRELDIFTAWEILIRSRVVNHDWVGHIGVMTSAILIFSLRIFASVGQIMLKGGKAYINLPLQLIWNASMYDDSGSGCHDA